MKRLILLFMALALSGCCRRAIPVASHRSDSVRVERETVYSERIRKDTGFVQIPPQSAQVQVRDSVSYLETDFAASRAMILSDGTLFHNLWNKTQKLAVEVAVKDTERTNRLDSVVYRDRVEQVAIKMPLSWWQRFLVWSGVAGWAGVAWVVFVRVGRFF